jgi:hypothetical protein
MAERGADTPPISSCLASPYIVTTDDQRMFQCSVDEVGSSKQRRWIFVDSDRVRHFGPPWQRLLVEDELRVLVNE